MGPDWVQLIHKENFTLWIRFIPYGRVDNNLLPERLVGPIALDPNKEIKSIWYFS